jgi:hypothetical protein
MLIHESKRLKCGDRIIDNYIGRKIRVFKSFIDSNTFLGIESLVKGTYVSTKLINNCKIAYQSLGQEIYGIGGSLRKQSRERPLLADR